MLNNKLRFRADNAILENLQKDADAREWSISHLIRWILNKYYQKSEQKKS